MIDLSLVPTDDLIITLLERFDHSVFSGIRENADGKGNHLVLRKWKGNSETCCGLATQLGVVITTITISESEHPKEMP